MRQRSVGLLLAVVCALGATIPAAPARADDGATYVSEGFKKLARKLGKQYARKALSHACPEDKPLCAALIAGVVEAFESIQAGETGSAEQALKASFVEATVVGGASLALPELTDIDPSLPAAERKAAEDLLKKFLVCASHIVRDRRSGGCDLKKEIVAKLKLVIGDQVLGNDRLYVERFIEDVSNGKRPTAETTLHVLAVIASSKAFKRDDFRVYILNLELAVAGGLQGGLYPFVERFLGAPNPQVDDIRSGYATIILATDAELVSQQAEVDKLNKSASDCGAGAAVTAWNKGRPGLRDRLRRQLLLGQQVSAADLALVDAFVGMKCTTPGADTSGVDALVRYGQYLRAALTMHNLDARYGAVLLSVAAVIDQVRSPDDALFEKRVRAIASRLVQQYQGAVCTAIRGSQDPETCLKVAEEKKPLCEFAVARALIAGEDVTQIKNCYPVVRAAKLASGATLDTVLCKEVAEGPALDGVTVGGAGKCKAPTKDTATGTVVFADVLDRLESLAGPVEGTVMVKGKLEEKLLYKLDEPERRLVLAAARATKLAMAGDSKGAAKVIGRLAVDEMITQFKEVAKAQLGADGEKCKEEVSETSVLFGNNRLCAVFLLVESVYVPIADEIWEGGVNESTASSIAKASYKRVLESDMLAGSPIILNVGLGANAIWGDAWETADGNPFGALTVVDKFGLVFYRRRGANWTFETGPFVGGFLDAIVRTVADEEHRAWLAGVTLGTTRSWGYDVGVQIHAAAAMPFAFEGFKDNVGWALGATVVVPWSDYLEED